MRSYLRMVLWMVGMLILAVPASANEEVVFSFQGRVRSGGTHFTGEGHFKLAIIVKEGNDNFVAWVNSGPITLGEPLYSVATEVTNGHFVVPVGDVSHENMAALPSVIFNTNKPMFMRVWFSDGVNGFEQLSPDSPIHNPKLFVREQENSVHLFVSAADGNDNWPGISAERPKKTIQAAVEALPAIITKPSTIQIADGYYFERVQLRNIMMGGAEGSLMIEGNPTTPTAVVVGSSPEQGGSAELHHSFVVQNSSGLTIKGVTSEGAARNGFSVRNSTLELANIVARDAEIYGVSLFQSDVTLRNVLISNCASGMIADGGQTFMFDSKISDITKEDAVQVVQGSFFAYRTRLERTAWAGIHANAGAVFGLWDCVINDCADPDKISWQKYAVYLQNNSFGSLYGTTIKNSKIGGVLARANSYVAFRRSSETNLKSMVYDNYRGVRVETLSGMESQDGDGLYLGPNTLFQYQKDATGTFINIPNP